MLQFVPMNGYKIKPVISDPHNKKKKKNLTRNLWQSLNMVHKLYSSITVMLNEKQ